MNFCAGAFFDHCVFPVGRTTAGNYYAKMCIRDRARLCQDARFDTKLQMNNTGQMDHAV